MIANCIVCKCNFELSRSSHVFCSTKCWSRNYRKRELYRTAHKVRSKVRRDALRAKAIAALGAACVKCGFTDVRALQIDHINGGGCAERKATTWNRIYNSIIELGSQGKYQLLCANCNWIKKYEQNEVCGSKSVQ